MREFIFKIFFVIMLLSILFSCATLKYAGVVRSNMDQNIPDAEVIIKTEEGENVTKTDASGNFKFTDIKADSVKAIISISAEGYDPYEEEIILVDKIPEMPPAITLDLAQTRVYGYVKDNNGTPLDHAFVYNTIYGEEISEQTDEKGKYSMTFEFSDIGEETEFIAFKEGYRDTSVWGKPVAYKTIQIEDIMMQKKEQVHSIIDLDGERDMGQIEGLGGGTVPVVGDISTSGVTDEFLVNYRGKYFKKNKFIEFMTQKGVGKNSAVSELRSLIKNGKIKKKGYQRYYVIPY